MTLHDAARQNGFPVNPYLQHRRPLTITRPPGLPLPDFKSAVRGHPPPLIASSTSSSPAPASTPAPFSLSTPTSNSASTPDRTPSATTTASDGLDRFASVYIPAWLRAVNDVPAPQILLPDLSRAQNLLEYAAQIYPKTLLEDFDAEDKAAEAKPAKTSAGTLRLAKLEATFEFTYALKLISLQLQEHADRKADLASAALFAATLEPFTNTDASRPIPPSLYRLQAPAIREGWPPLDINDIVVLRQLRPDIYSWQGLEFVATVYAVQRVAGLVVVRCEALADYKESMLFNVSFRPQDRPFLAAHKAMEILDRDLRRASARGKAVRASLAAAWLFPTSHHYLLPLPDGDAATLPANFRLIDSALNAEQELAVKSIVFSRRRIPFLISGPPGTGKTKTVVETVLQILKAYPDAHCLVCGASNPSSDTLATRLSKHLTPLQMLRVSDESRPLNEVPLSLLPFCSIADERFALPDLSELLKYRVIVTSVLDASVLVSARVTNTHLARLEARTLRTLRPEAYNPTSYHFDYLLIDEAAQASEPEIAPALAVLLPDTATTYSQEEHSQRRLPQLVLCGDDKQLGPYITSQAARDCELDQSLLARLFERPLYKMHPGARHARTDGKRHRLLSPSLEASCEPDASQENGTSPSPSDLSQPFANLIRNYRSHVGLLMVPSSLFYSDTLLPCASKAVQTTTLLKWDRLKGPEIPLLISHTEGQEEQIDEGASWYNPIEVDRVVEVTKSLIYRQRADGSTAQHGQVQAKDISVISPFREQVWKIRLALRTLGLGDINVGRESDMQGAENRIIIISTVRSSHRFIPDDKRRNRGLILESKRFNVATTRAKELLIVIGDVKILYSDPYWRAYIRFAIRRNAYDGPSLEEFGAQTETDAGLISRLEEEFVLGKSGEGDSMESSQEMLAGSVARMALLGEE